MRSGWLGQGYPAESHPATRPAGRRTSGGTSGCLSSGLDRDRQGQGNASIWASAARTMVVQALVEPGQLQRRRGESGQIRMALT
jgi:hypothetical protein